MSSNLFRKIDYKNDPYCIVKDALNMMNRYSFPKAVNYWLNGISYDGDGGGIDFPDEEDNFESVRCYYLGGFDEEETVVSKEEFFSLLKQACKRYIELHPEKREELEQIMSQSTLV